MPVSVTDRALIDDLGAPFTRWQLGLILRKRDHVGGGEAGVGTIPAGIVKRQKDLDQALRGGPRTLGLYLREAINLGRGVEIQAPALPRLRLTSAEYRDPPLELEEEIGRAWDGLLHPNTASRPVFWTLCHIAWIEQEQLGTDGFGLHEALMAGHGEDSSERRTRNFLRRAGGLFAGRGNVSVYSDCTVARAWWRYEIARQVAAVTARAGSPLSRRSAHRALHVNRPAWEQLIMLSLRRLTVINDARARAQLVCYLQRVLRGGRPVRKTHVSTAAVAVARLALGRSITMTPWTDLERVMPPVE